MIRCLVNIANTFDQSFRIHLEIPIDSLEESLGNYGKGSWKTIQYGDIRFPSGWSEGQRSSGTLTTLHIKLCSKEENTWGIRLNDFRDFWGPNKNGDGLILQPWCVSFKPGLINWTLIEAN
jgi:hypothetical protein